MESARPSSKRADPTMKAPDYSAAALAAATWRGCMMQ
jgi:hypothetical protein